MDGQMDKVKGRIKQALGDLTKINDWKPKETEGKSFLLVFEAAYAQELKVSGLINDLVDLAKSEGDHATEIMLHCFVTEQVEEENTANSNVERFKFVKDTTEGIEGFDRELGARKLV